MPTLDLSNVPLEELEKAVAKRRADAKNLPKLLGEPNFESLVAFVVESHKQMVSDEHEDEDFAHYVYEHVMEAMYGNAYWRWRNSREWSE